MEIVICCYWSWPCDLECTAHVLSSVSTQVSQYPLHSHFTLLIDIDLISLQYLHSNVYQPPGMLWDALGCSGMLWDAQRFFYWREGDNVSIEKKNIYMNQAESRDGERKKKIKKQKKETKDARHLSIMRRRRMSWLLTKKKEKKKQKQKKKQKKKKKDPKNWKMASTVRAHRKSDRVIIFAGCRKIRTHFGHFRVLEHRNLFSRSSTIIQVNIISILISELLNYNIILILII